MVCGSTEIDGYAFCLGVESWKGFYDAQPHLRSLIRSVLYLIRGAIFRSKGSDRVSKEKCPLGELIDMYHAHEATLHSDKVYSLLGMSSDDLSKASLLPDYNVSWKDLFETLIRFLLCKEIFVEASSDKEIAVIQSEGYILGKVSSIPRNINWNSGQGVDVIWRNSLGTLGFTGKRSSHWTLQSSAEPVMIGDVICLLQGASNLTIIRFCEDHWAIIRIAATPPQIILTRNKDVEWLKYLQLAKPISSRNFQCVWDWETSPGKLQRQGEYEELQGYLDKVIRSWNFALVLGDIEEYGKAEEKFQEAMEGYGSTVGKERERDMVVNQLSSANGADLDLMNSQYGQPPLSWAAERGHVAIVELLIRTDRVNVNIKDMNGKAPLLLAALGGHLAVVERLLEKKAEINAAASSGYFARTALQAAAEGGHLAVVERLLEEKAEVNATAAYGNEGITALQAAAEGGHLAVVERLLKEKAEVNAAASAGDRGRTALQAAAEGGHLAVVERLLEEKAEVNAAAAAGKEGKTAL
jgi:hypothetical protein